ncbi:MAG: hypothetical protein VX038_03305 [Verrucomicrobiota bacterium]|nr:hypothetical protein [Verrucomicrobiota bacterium]
MKGNGEQILDLKFNLIGVSGKLYNESIFEEDKRKILFFISPHCRYSSKFIEFTGKLHKEGNSDNQEIYLISPNYPQALIPDDLSYTDLHVTIDGMKELAVRNNLHMPFIYDGDNQTLANYFSINITPAVVYLGKRNNLIYKGKIGEITPTGEIDTSYFEKIIDGDDEEQLIVTKLRGTEVKTKKDLSTTSEVLRRYANETVRITEAKEDRIAFYLKFHNKKITIFFVWQTSDFACQENLLKITEIYKIYRKRGLSLVTICISENANEAIDILKKTQSSGHNFYSNFYETNPIFEMTSMKSKITPTILALGKKGKIFFRAQKRLNIEELKSSIIQNLENQ